MAQEDVAREIDEFLLEFADNEVIREFLLLCVGRVLKNKAKKRFDWRAEADKTKISHIVDWLNIALLDNDPWVTNRNNHNQPKKLLKYSNIDEIYAEAVQILTKKTELLPIQTLDHDEERIIENFDNEYFIVQLLTTKALDNESAHMQHCVGLGGYDKGLLSGKTIIYSLRDKYNKPHVTIEFSSEKERIVQVRGKQNRKPVEKYAKWIRKFVENRNHKLDIDIKIIGWIDDAFRQRWEINKLPEDFYYVGNLNLNGCDLKELPKNMRVDGDLNISMSEIQEIPDSALIKGSLIANFSKLKQVTSRHRIGGSIDLTGSKNVQLLEKLNIYGDLDISGTNITHIPSGTIIVGNLICHYGKLRRVSNIAIGKSIDFVKLDDIDFGDDDIYIGGHLHARECVIGVGNRLDIEESMLLKDTYITGNINNIFVGKKAYIDGGNIKKRSLFIRTGTFRAYRQPAFKITSNSKFYLADD